MLVRDKFAPGARRNFKEKKMHAIDPGNHEDKVKWAKILIHLYEEIGAKKSVASLVEETDRVFQINESISKYFSPKAQT